MLAEHTNGAAAGLRALMPEWLRGDFLGVEGWQLVGLALVVLLGLVVRRVAVYLFVRWVQRATERLGPGWLSRLVAKADRPAGLLVVAGWIALSLPLLALSAGAAAVVGLAVRSLATISVVWLLYRLVDVLSDILAERAAQTASKLDDQLVPLLRKSLKLVLVVVGAVFLLQNLEVDVGSLLAGLGLGGLAFALAAKDTVANFFGSLMIFVDKPFQIGDWIVMAPDIEGTVEEVGFRSSRIRTFHNSVVSVPNANVANTAVDNMGARRYRRYKTTLGLTYDTPPTAIQAFCEGVRSLIEAAPSTRKDYYVVEFSAFGASALEVLVYCFFETPDWASELRARTELNLAIARLVQTLGLSFAFPTQTVHVVAPPPAPDVTPSARGHHDPPS